MRPDYISYVDLDAAEYGINKSAPTVRDVVFMGCAHNVSGDEV